ncbi:MAG: sigma-54 interaction domain-containing protein, partial [Thermodesulfobacteriota bacterium]
KKTLHSLEERIKELSALHHTTKLLVGEKKTIPDVLQEIVVLLPSSWQYPEITAARIKCEDIEFKTSNFIQTNWKQTASFTTVDGKQGIIEIVYLEEKPIDFEGPFLKEERSLINSLAEMLESFIERKNSERILLESEERYRSLVEYSPEGIYVHSGGKIVYINPAGAKLLGAASPEELMNKPVLSFIHPDHVEIVKDRIRQVQVEGKPEEANVELKFIRLDGKVIYVKVARTPIIYQGKPAVQAATSDITERKRAEEALRKALSEVEKLKNQLQAENTYLQEEIKTEYNFQEIIGQSELIQKLLRKVEQVAPTDTTVLIQGETGTGKELIARAIHNLSSRANRPLVKVNCAAISAGLVESELFGHEKGAFTGAIQQRIGRFELANGGTIFLDEIGDLPLDTQVKLLRVLQEEEFERVGSSKSIRVDVRVIAATNRDLAEAITAGSFRSDLFFRLNVFPLEIPPLRERKSDIPFLVNFFLSKFAKKLGKKIDGVSKNTMDLLMNYVWPGNIRELQNVIERAIVLARSPILHIDESSMLKIDTRLEANFSTSDSKKLEDIERLHILSVLEETKWVIEGKRGAALVLGLNHSTLRSRMQKLGIKKPGKLS